MRRLSLLYLVLLGLFWGFVHSASTRFEYYPHVQASFRYSPFWCEESAWKYTGRRPGPGEQLVLYWRTANRYEPGSLRLRAYLGGVVGGPDPKAVHFEARSSQSSFFEFGRVVIPPWPAGQQLFLSMQWAKNAQVWWETGEFANEPLESIGWERKGGESGFRPAIRPFFSSFDVHVEPSGSAPQMELRAHRGWIARWAAAWGAVFLLGFIIVGRARRAWWSLATVILGTMAYESFCAIMPTQYFWGGFYLARLGMRYFWVGLVAVQVMLFPPIMPWLWAGGTRLAGWLRPVSRRRLAFVATAVAALGLAAICWTHPSRGIYGDGFGPLGAPGYAYHNPLGLALYTLFREAFPAVVRWHNLHFKPPWPVSAGYGDMDWLPYFQILFVPLYVIAAAGIARQVGRSPSERVLVALVLLSGKTILTQFRYYEIYGPAVAVSATAIWLTLRAARLGRELIVASIASFVAYLFHLGFAPFVFVVAALCLARWWHARLRLGWLVDRVSVTTVFALAVWLQVCLVLYALKFRWSWPEYVQAVPQGGLAMLHGWTGIPADVDFLHKDVASMFYTHHYPWKSWYHVSQWTMVHTFALGPIGPILAVVALAGFLRVLRSSLGWGFGAAATFFVVSSFFLFTSFPYPKDWDFLSQNALIISSTCLLFATRLGCVNRPTTRWLLGAILVHQLWDTGMWLTYNLTCGPPVTDRNFVFF